MAKHRGQKITAREALVKQVLTTILHFISITAVGLPSILFFEAFRGFFESGFEVVHTTFTSVL